MKRIFVICSVRGMDDEYRKTLENYVAALEEKGWEVHLPHRDTDQEASGFDICTQNMNAINKADEIHIFYSEKSTGTHFDLGVAFALNKKLVIIDAPNLTVGKSFLRMIHEWVDLQDQNYNTNLPDTWNQTGSSRTVSFLLGEEPEMVTFLKSHTKNSNGDFFYHVIEEDAYSLKPDGKDIWLTANQIQKKFNIDIKAHLP